jgi:hypothetical protein
MIEKALDIPQTICYNEDTSREQHTTHHTETAREVRTGRK